MMSTDLNAVSTGLVSVLSEFPPGKLTWPLKNKSLDDLKIVLIILL